MVSNMRRIGIFILGIGLMIVPATVSADPLPSASCKNITGTFLGQVVPTASGFDGYVIATTGPLAGNAPDSKLFSETVQKVTRGGTTFYTGNHAFETIALGAFSTHDTGLITPHGRVNSTLTIFEGGSGAISAHGAVDLATGLLEIRYHGRVCTE